MPQTRATLNFCGTYSVCANFRICEAGRQPHKPSQPTLWPCPTDIVHSICASLAQAVVHMKKIAQSRRATISANKDMVLITATESTCNATRESFEQVHPTPRMAPICVLDIQEEWSLQLGQSFCEPSNQFSLVQWFSLRQSGQHLCD